ncbi:MAG: FAD-dependent oxidoreductase, partial [Elusimicrobiota bacterium]|nr:FAD-dependent oxidoreductase [Elusimicrobiota bacterium]
MELKAKVVIIGAGISGLATAFHMKNDYIILEKEATAGGLCRSVNTNGFIFDYTGHFLHVQSEYVKGIIFDLLKSNIKKVKRSSWIYSNNVYTRYPFQANLYGLPDKVITECINGLIDAKLANSQPRANPASQSTLSHTASLNTQLSFQDWVVSTFGRGFAKHFFLPYNKKLWQFDLNHLTCDWVGKFVPEPNLCEVLKGAFTPPLHAASSPSGRIRAGFIDKPKEYGYNVYFYYPRKGGIQSLINALVSRVKNLYLNTMVEKVNLKEKYLVTNIGKIHYEYLVTTIPLVEFLAIIDNLPTEIQQLKNQLEWNSVLCINLGIERANIHPNKHWVYFPEEKYVFYRIGFYHNFSKSSVPKNSSS